MGRQHSTPFGMSSTIRNSSSSIGRIITTHARGDPRRYSIYSQVQACDLSYHLPHMMVAWPIIDDTGTEPAPAQKMVALGGHPFWLGKVHQGDFYALDALSNISATKVWMWVLNSFADAAFANAFDAWSVFAIANTNSRRVENGFFRKGSSQYDDLPTRLQSFVPIPWLPSPSPCPLTHSQSEETFSRLTVVRPTTTRSRWESDLVYLREFTSSDAAPPHVGFVATGHEHPMTIDVIRERFAPEARPFIIIIQVSLRITFLNIGESDLVSSFNEELRLMFPLRMAEEIIETPTTCPPDCIITFVSAASELMPLSHSSSSTSNSVDHGVVCRKCGVSGHRRRDCPYLDDFRSGNPQDAMLERLKRAMSIDKVEILMSTVAGSTRARYKSGWVDWRHFCSGLEISPKLDPSAPDWDIPLLDFPTWGHKIMGAGYSGLVTRYSAIRFVHLIEGCDLSKASFRVRSFSNAINCMNPVTKRPL